MTCCPMTYHLRHAGLFVLLASIAMATGCQETIEQETIDAPPQIDDLPTPSADPNDWPWWQGPTRNNRCAPGQSPPMNWSETENVLWRVSLPGHGHATPCIVGDRMYVPSGDPEQETIWMTCLDLATGDTLWQREIHKGPPPKIHGDNTFASATPACDGVRIFFPYQTENEIRLVALSLDGKIVWNESLSPYKSIQGFSASAVLHRAAVIVPVDGTDNTLISARHRETGKTIWQADVPGDHESYASVTVAEVAGRTQVILVGPDNIRSYHADTGEALWECDGPAQCYVAAAVADEQTVYATGGWPKRALMAIRGDGSGNVTETHVTWKSDARVGYVPTPLLADGLLYAVRDEGTMRCYEAATGEILWEESLSGKYYSSPVLVDDKIYLFNRTGKAYILRSGRTLKVLAENELPHGMFATPVIRGDRIYLRTLGDLYCLGAK